MKKPHIKIMDLILLILGVLYTAFVVTMIRIFKETGLEPTTLIVSVTGAIFGECGFMALIQSTKIRREDREWQLEDEKRMKEERERNEQ